MPTDKIISISFTLLRSIAFMTCIMISFSFGFYFNQNKVFGSEVATESLTKPIQECPVCEKTSLTPVKVAPSIPAVNSDKFNQLRINLDRMKQQRLNNQ